MEKSGPIKEGLNRDLGPVYESLSSRQNKIMAVYKRGDNWCIGYRLPNGKYRREKVGPSNALAKEVFAKRLTEVAEGRFFPGRIANARQFAEFADKYLDLHARHLKGASWKLMILHARRRFGTLRMGAIGPSEIQRYYNEIVARASNATANRNLSLLKSMFNKAKAWGDFYGENPCAAIKKLREPQGRLRYLSVEEMVRLLAVAHPRLYPVLMCALHTGMRRGEIFGMDWKNISLEQGMIYILESKSGRPREIPITMKLREVLLAQGQRPEGPVFKLPYIMLRRYFERALGEADIHGFRFHDLRHTFASHFIMRTNNLPALQKLLGHSTPTMTLRYAHLSRGHMASEMAAFESVMPVGAPSSAQRLVREVLGAPAADQPTAG